MPSSTAAGYLLSRVPVWTGLALAATLTGAACAKKPVVVMADPPPLAVPTVPPRLVGPVQVEEAPPPPVDEAPERPAPRTTPRAPRVTRSEPARPAEGSGSAEPPKVEAPEPPVEAPSPNLLRTAETADDREATKRVKDIISRAETNLSKVNYKALSTSARAQHDNITRLIAQAEEALKSRSFTFARYLADKAEVLSGSLANR
jgi:hypothetical protein